MAKHSDRAEFHSHKFMRILDRNRTEFDKQQLFSEKQLHELTMELATTLGPMVKSFADKYIQHGVDPELVQAIASNAVVQVLFDEDV